MKKINKKLSLCIALALMQSVYVSNSFAADATGVTNQGSRYYFGVGTEPTLEDLSKKGIIDYKKASQNIRRPAKSLKIIMRMEKAQGLTP